MPVYYQHTGNYQPIMEKVKLLALTRYTSEGPSSRVRFFQYFPELENAGFDIQTEPFFSESYITSLFENKPKPLLDIAASYFHRVGVILAQHRFNVIWMQYELLPWLPFWMENLLISKKSKLVVDYDDAVFHRYDKHRLPIVRAMLGKKIDRVMRLADLVIVGNAYLAERAAAAGAQRIEILPSVVDFHAYQRGTHLKKDDQFTVGWLGSPQTVKYLIDFKTMIKKVLSEGVRFAIVGAPVPQVLKEYPLESWHWTLENEVDLIHQMDVGIMPLVDSPFERGKCGYKLIQYMACGLPVIASPVGINQKLVVPGENGFLARNDKEWIEAILVLKNDRETRIKMGQAGRNLVKEAYSLEVNAPKLIKFLKSLV